MRFLVFPIFLALQGCVGVETLHDVTTHAESINDAYYLAERGKIDGGARHPVRTKDDVRQLWGEPDAI